MKWSLIVSTIESAITFSLLIIMVKVLSTMEMYLRKREALIEASISNSLIIIVLIELRYHHGLRML